MIEELYRAMDDWLVDQNSDIRASEVQGLLAGLMAANLNIRPDEISEQPASRPLQLVI